MEKVAIMNSEKIRLRFDGPALAEHSIDVSVLGPSLTGLGELLRAANVVANGKDVKVSVVMNADVEANCVTMDFAVIQSIFESISKLLGTDQVKNAKEILEWLGILSTGVGVTTLTVWKLYAWVAKNRKPGQKITTTTEEGKVVININGTGNTVNVDPMVYKLAADPRVRSGYLQLMSPLGEPGIEEAAFVHNSDEILITQEEAKPVLEAGEVDLDLDVDPQIVEGHIVIYSPVLVANAKTWKFKWNDRVESINIGKSNIAQTILDRGKVVVGDAFRVKMEVVEKRRKKQGYKQHFTVIEVLEFKPFDGSAQGALPFDRDSSA